MEEAAVQQAAAVDAHCSPSLLVHRMPARNCSPIGWWLAVLISAANGEMILIYLLLIISAAKSPLPGYSKLKPRLPQELAGCSGASLREEVGAGIGRCVFFGIRRCKTRARRITKSDGQPEIGRMRACAAPNEINRQMHSI